MNANELADLIGMCGDGGYNQDAATMLRQQQAEIEALKKDNKELHDIAQRMAMAESDARKSLQWIKDVEAMGSSAHTELTDEEIIKMYEDMLGVASAKGSVIDFAKAILRKAQNK